MVIKEWISHLGGHEILQLNYPKSLGELVEVISSIDAEEHRTKLSKEKTKNERVLISPKGLNRAIAREMLSRDWRPLRRKGAGRAWREIDFMKNRVAVEAQFGKYSFIDTDLKKLHVCFKHGHIDVGVIILPMKVMTCQMSSGVADFERAKWDEETLDRSDPPVPICYIGIAHQ